MSLVGVSEAAAQLGLNKSTVSRQVKAFAATGLLAVNGGKFDLDAYRDARRGGTNPLKARNRDGELGYEPSLAEASGETPPAGAPRVGSLGLAQAAEKAIGARLKQLELAKRLGKVVDRASVDAAGAELAVLLRDGLRGRNRRIAESVAAVNDPNEIEALLDREDAALLENLRQLLAKQLAPKEPEHVAA